MLQPTSPQGHSGATRPVWFRAHSTHRAAAEPSSTIAHPRPPLRRRTAYCLGAHPVLLPPPTTEHLQPCNPDRALRRPDEGRTIARAFGTDTPALKAEARSAALPSARTAAARVGSYVHPHR